MAHLTKSPYEHVLIKNEHMLILEDPFGFGKIFFATKNTCDRLKPGSEQSFTPKEILGLRKTKVQKSMPSEKTETRQLILDGAKKVIREKGLAGATTREIARKVGCA